MERILGKIIYGYRTYVDFEGGGGGGGRVEL